MTYVNSTRPLLPKYCGEMVDSVSKFQPLWWHQVRELIRYFVELDLPYGFHLIQTYLSSTQ